MALTIKVDGAEVLRRQLRGAHGRIDKALAKHIYDQEVKPLAEAITRAGLRVGGPATLAARTVKATRLANGGRITAPSGSGKPADVFFGAEFGGGARPKVTYLTHSRRGKPYKVSRHTTHQFLPFKGTTGYFYFPTTRTYLRGIRSRVLKVATKAANSDR